MSLNIPLSPGLSIFAFINGVFRASDPGILGNGHSPVFGTLYRPCTVGLLSCLGIVEETLFFKKGFSSVIETTRWGRPG